MYNIMILECGIFSVGVATIYGDIQTHGHTLIMQHLLRCGYYSRAASDCSFYTGTVFVILIKERCHGALQYNIFLNRSHRCGDVSA